MSTHYLDYMINVITLAGLLGFGYYQHRKTKTSNGSSLGELSELTQWKVECLENEVKKLNEQIEALHNRLNYLFTWLLKNK